MYWCVVTMTSVGYGDYFPITNGGRVVGIFTLFFGVMFIAMPVIIIGREFLGATAHFELHRVDDLVTSKIWQKGS